jgi:hypothetical protein
MRVAPSQSGVKNNVMHSRYPQRYKAYQLTVGIFLALFSAHAGADDDLLRQKTTMADLGALGLAMDEYKRDHGAFPIVPRGTVDKLEQLLVPDYLKRFDRVDGWGTPIRVVSSGVSFAIWSNGRDGAEETSPDGGPQDSPDADIIFAQGVGDHGYFWQGPRGRDNVAGWRYGPNPVVTAERELEVLVELGVVTRP